MYKSPIDIFYGQIETHIEGEIMKAAQKLHVNVDKDELLRALQYDRGQYEKGYDDAIAELEAKSKWIPVTERLPEKYQLALAVCKSGKIFVGEYVDLGWRTLWRIRTARDSTKEITQIVTHWMPLPDAPTTCHMTSKQPPKGE